MSRRLLPVLAVLAATTAAACGSGSKTAAPTPSCQDDRAALAGIGSVQSLEDAKRALQQVIAVERRAAVRLRESGKAENASATQLLLARRAATRSLQEINGDAQGAMDPVRTGVPAARRAVAIADGLLRPLCASG